MKLIEVLEQLGRIDIPTFQTSDAAAILRIEPAHASQLLKRLTQTFHLIRLKRGLWAFPDRMEAIQLPQFLLSPMPCYISLQTALYLHGMIEQVPHVFYAVSLARTKRIKTPLGTVSIHHIEPNFFFGFKKDEKIGVNIATPEKALIDILYLTQARSGIFKSLPELEITNFSFAKAKGIIKKIHSPKRRKLVEDRLKQIISTCT